MRNHRGLCVLHVLNSSVQQQDTPGQELQIKPDIRRQGAEGGRVHPEVEFAIQQARGDGQFLESAVQEQMGASLGYDFSKVRIHTGPRADELNRWLSARAFTIGTDIFFRQGAYAPASISGRKLIAHELVHVLQQASGRVSGVGSGLSLRPTDDPLEREADILGWRAAAGLICGGERLALGGRRHQSVAIQRTAATFAWWAKTAPPAGIQTCHEAALYWKLLDLPTQAPAALLQAIRNQVAVVGVGGAAGGAAAVGVGAPMGACIPNPWFHRLYPVVTRISNRQELRDRVHVGDLLITGSNLWPAHTMVVVRNSSWMGRWRTYIRGFNNIGTLGRGLANAYDNNDRDLDQDRYWHGDLFGNGGQPLYVLPHWYYWMSVRSLVHNHCIYAAGVWTYNP